MALGALQQRQPLLSSGANALGEYMEEFKQRLLRLQKHKCQAWAISGAPTILRCH